MITKARARAGGSQLAAYLLNRDGEERAELLEMRGLDCFGGSLRNALIGLEIESKEHARQNPFYHVSFRFEEGAELTPEQWRECADRLEKNLDLVGNPRALVMHEENGQKHLHVVWSRTNDETGSYNYLHNDRYKCRDTGRELEREFGTRQLPYTRQQEHPTRADHEQAKRQSRDIADIKAEIREAWEQSDNGASFENALADAGYILAKGDKRDFVAVDRTGQEYTIGKRITGATAAQTRTKCADLDRDFLPTVEEARGYQKDRQGQNQQQEQARAEREAEQKKQTPPEQEKQQEQPEQAQQAPIQKPRLKFDLDRQQWTTAAAPVMTPEQFKAKEATRAALREKWQELATQARAPLREKWQELTTQAHATRDQSDQAHAAEALETDDRAEAVHYVAEQTRAALRGEEAPDYKTHAAEVTKARAEGENWQRQHDQDKTTAHATRDQTRAAEALERATESPDREAQKAKTHTPDREKPAAPSVGRPAAALGNAVLNLADGLLGGIGGPVTHEQTRQQAAGTQQRTAQQVQDAAAQIRQPLTPQEREAKAKEFDRAAEEATRARDAYRKAQINAKPPEFRKALQAEYRANFDAKEAAKQAALLRETQQQREERQAKEREEREAERRRKERQRDR